MEALCEASTALGECFDHIAGSLKSPIPDPLALYTRWNTLKALKGRKNLKNLENRPTWIVSVIIPITNWALSKKR